MGIYDRDYYREPRSGFALRLPQTMIGRLILVTAALWMIDGVFCSETHRLARLMEVSVGALGRPLDWWRFLTYGFMHDPATPAHILLNMFALWMFGAEVETLYGRNEFLRLYLVLLAAGSIVWAVTNRLLGAPDSLGLVGASAAVVGVLLLFVLHYPRRTILFMFVIPMPAWVLGVILVGGDVLAAMGRSAGDRVAYSAHLAGAATAFLYFHFGWNFGRLWDVVAAKLRRPGRPPLKIHHPDRAEPDDEPAAGDLGQQVDHILEKIHREGEASLTRHERSILETASREYQKRRRSPQR